MGLFTSVVEDVVSRVTADVERNRRRQMERQFERQDRIDDAPPRSISEPRQWQLDQQANRDPQPTPFETRRLRDIAMQYEPINRFTGQPMDTSESPFSRYAPSSATGYQRRLGNTRLMLQRVAMGLDPDYAGAAADRSLAGSDIVPDFFGVKMDNEDVLSAPYDLARTEIPFSRRFAEFAGDNIRRYGDPIASVAPQTALVQAAGERLPYVPTPSGVAAEAVETSVPTEVWMAALELVPGIGTVPDLMRAARRGAPEVLAALAKVSADNPRVLAAVRKLHANESGMVRLGWFDAQTQAAREAEAAWKQELRRRDLTPEDRAAVRKLRLVEGQKAAILADPKMRLGANEEQAEDLLRVALERGRDDVAQELSRREIPFGGRAGLSQRDVKRMTNRGGSRRFMNKFPALGPDQLVARMDAYDELLDTFDAGVPGARPPQPDEAFPTAPAPFSEWRYGEVPSTNQRGWFRTERGAHHAEFVDDATGQTERIYPTSIRKIEPPEGATPPASEAAPLPAEQPPVRSAGPPDPSQPLESASPSPALPPATPPEALTPDAAMLPEPPQRAQERATAAEGAGGGEPPIQPPTAVGGAEPPSGDVLPPVIERVTRDLVDAALTRAERRTIIRAGRQRQAAKLGTAIEGKGSTLDKAMAARGAERGKIVPGIKPIGDRYTPAEVDEVFSTIDQAYHAGAINRFEYPNATSALNLLFTGERLPTASDARLPLHLMPSEIKLLGRVFGPEFEKALPTSKADLTLFQRMIDVANVPRSLQTMLDLSASLRQGSMLGIRNPVEWGRAFKRQIVAMNSHQAFTDTIEAIRQMPSYESGQRSGLRIVGTAGDVNAEEAFLSTTAEKIPGIGRFVKGSERGYNAFLNYLRQSVFEKQYTRLSRMAETQGWAPERLDDALEQMATFINHATGQGDVGFLRDYVPTMNALFFSPKFVISRPQAVWDLVKPGVDPAVRRATAENLAAFFGAGSAILAAVQLSGVGDVSLDPRSSDFAKVRIGNTRFDFWAGYQPLVRYASQIASGERAELFTGDVSKVNRGKTLGRFLRSKLSPVGALGWDVIIEGGKDYEGDNLDPRNPLSVADRALRSVTPLFVQNMYDAFNDGGAKTLAITAVPSALGVGTGTYGPSQEVQSEIKRDAFANDELKSAGASIKNGQVVLDAWEENWKRDGAHIAAELGLEFAASRSELRDAFVERWQPEYLTDFPTLGEKQARADLGNLFDKQDAVKSYDTARKRARLEFWKANPELLEQAVGLGLESLNEEERKILAEAR